MSVLIKMTNYNTHTTLNQYWECSRALKILFPDRIYAARGPAVGLRFTRLQNVADIFQLKQKNCLKWKYFRSCKRRRRNL